MSSASNEIIWLWRLLREFGVFLNGPTPLHADNTSAIGIAKNTIFHERTKHIEVECHFIRQRVVKGTIQLPHVSSEHQLADLFPKAMPKSSHDYLSSKLLLLPNPRQFEGECTENKTHT